MPIDALRGDPPAVLADADEDRAVGRHDRIAAVMLGRRAVLPVVDVAREDREHFLCTGDQIDAGDDIVEDLASLPGRVVNDRGAIVDEGHAQKTRITAGRRRKRSYANALAGFEPVD